MYNALEDENEYKILFEKSDGKIALRTLVYK
jgi:hypothetical protein